MNSLTHPTPHVSRNTAPARAQSTKAGQPRFVLAMPDGAAVLAGMLLTAVAASLAVLANEVVTTWADEHLFVAWTAMWLIAFATLALVASSCREVSCAAMARVATWRVRRAQERADAAYWQVARNDQRLMAELQAAVDRH